MSSSNSNLPAVILGVIVVVVLAVFYIADRSSQPDATGAMHSANEQHDAYEQSDSHAGFSGSIQEYLNNY